MNDIQQNPNPAKPSRPSLSQQTLRVPVTRLVNPPPRKPLERPAPLEEPVNEPWDEAAEDVEASQDLDGVKEPQPGAAALPPPRRFNPPRPLGQGSQGSQKPALGTRPAVDASRAAPAPASRPVPRAPLPRMEMKPVIPADPARAGINVAPAPRLPAPPPRASQVLSPLEGRDGRDGTAPVPADQDPPARFTPLPRPAAPVFPRPRPGLTREPVSQASEPVEALDEDEAQPEANQPAGFAPASEPVQETGFSQAPELAQVLERLVNLPAQTAILGVCDDRLPVLLDLADPTPGAVLVASDDEVLRTRLLRTLVQTAAALNSPRSVQFLVLSTCPDEWQRWLDGLDAARHCLGVDSLLEGSPERWLLKLSGWADQRRTGSSSGPAVILIVDDLAAVPQLEYDARVNFDWLVKEGPGVRIWPVVGLAVDEAPNLVRWVRLFKTRLLGPAADPSLYRQLAALDAQESASLVQPAQFAVHIQENWLKFRLPILPGESA